MKIKEKLQFIIRRYGLYVSFTNSWSDNLSLEEIQYMRMAIIRTNVDRTFLISIAMLFISLIYGINSIVHPAGIPIGMRMLNFGLLIGTSLFGMFYMLDRIYKRILTHTVKTVTMLFWYWLGILTVMILPSDSFTFYGIINYIIYMSLVSILPILESVCIVPFMIVLFLLQIISMVIAGAESVHIVFCAVYTVCAVIMSRITFNTVIAAEKTSGRIGEYAKHDQLTLLLNRRGFDSWLKEHRQDFLEKPSACGFIDIDFFKQYNDTFGHMQGDECLKTVSACIRSRFESGKNAVFRFGGEEFVVLISNSTPYEAQRELVALKAAIEKLRMETARKDVSQYVTVSIGYTCRAVGEPFDIDEIIAEADKALYSAKQKSRNTVCRYGES